MLRALLPLLAACAPVTTAMSIDPPPHKLVSTAPDRVAVFAREEPRQPHVEVALLYASDTDDDRGRLVSALRGRAAELGCDAIVLDGMAGTKRVTTGYFDDDLGRWRKVRENDQVGMYATCIAYR
jgi:hypothetical protein